jgi:uncharacterized delta-60 repeat protein
MKAKIFTALFSLIILLCFTAQAQFSQPGELDTTFNFGRPHSFFTNLGNLQPGVGADADIWNLALQPDGKVLIVGAFSSFNGAPRNCIARLNADGSIDTTFNPGTGVVGVNSIILTICLQPDGKVLIGGNFTNYNGTPRNRIARLNANGSLDTTFNPGTGIGGFAPSVNSMVLQPDGKILIGGNFNSYNGSPRNCIARLNANGSLDATFDIGAGLGGTVPSVNSMVLQPDGKIVIGGNFISYNGTSRNNIARLNADGSLDASFIVGSGFVGGASGVYVAALVIQPDNKVLVGGQFVSYGGTPCNNIARLNANGIFDDSFNTGTGVEGLPPSVSTIALQNDGKIFIGGDFFRYNNINRNNIARLNSNGSLDVTFNPAMGPGSSVRAIVLQANSKILIGGWFRNYNGILCNYIARLNGDGVFDVTFNQGVGANNNISCIAVQQDNKILIGGHFNIFNGTFRNFIARLNPDGNIDSSFSPGANNIILSLALQPDGKVLIGGQFTSFNSTPQRCIVRLNPDGSLDAGFNIGTGVTGGISNPSNVRTLALQPDGKVVIGGNFTSFNGTARSCIARLNADGSLDAGFNPGTGTNGEVRCLALQPDGKVLIAGMFTSYNGTPRNYLARLNADGSLDNTFNSGTGANDWVQTLTLQPDGKVLIGGDFTTYNGTNRRRIARLNADGSLDATFTIGNGANNTVRTLTLQPDGKVLIGGEFTFYRGTSINRIARLNGDGSLDTTFKVGSGVSGGTLGGASVVFSLTLQPDGKLLVGGDFFAYNQIYRSRIARVFATDAITGLSDEGQNTKQYFSVYPVPFSNKLTIKAEGKFRYEIMDVRGANKVSGLSQATEATCSTENLASGMYLLKLTLNGKSYLRKIIKE